MIDFGISAPGNVKFRASARKLATTARAATLIAAICAMALLARADRAYADPQARAASNEIVTHAEAIILQAGKSRPADTAAIHRAIDQLHRALDIDPQNDAAYVDLGFCYGVLRDAPSAVDMYLKATQLNPSGGNFKELADIYMRVGDPNDALMAANAGLQKDPNNAQLYNAKGMALNDLQRVDEAVEAFEKAIKLDPTLAVARSNLATLNSGPSGRGAITKHSQAQ